jgi:hypothetical protein
MYGNSDIIVGERNCERKSDMCTYKELRCLFGNGLVIQLACSSRLGKIGAILYFGKRRPRRITPRHQG